MEPATRTAGCLIVLPHPRHFIHPPGQPLHESDPFNHDLDYYREVLRHFQILVPESLFIEVQHDAERNVGNRVVKHQADGSFTEREL